MSAIAYDFISAIPTGLPGGSVGALTQSAGSLPAPLTGSDGVLTRLAWTAANRFIPTDVDIFFTGAAQTVSNGFLWGWVAEDSKWYQAFVFDTPITITGVSQGAVRRVTGVGHFDRLAVSGTASVGSVTITFRGLALFA